MHDELRAAGLRRVRLGMVLLFVLAAVGGAVVAAIVTLDPRASLTWELFTGGSRTLVIGAAAGAIGMLGLFAAAGDRRSARKAWPTRELSAAPDLVTIAEGPALARGVATPSVWRLESSAPNVACLPRHDGLHVVVSTAAERGLERDELEALIALQMSLLLDPAAARVRRPLYAGSRAITWSIRLPLLGAIVPTVRNVAWAGLTINLGVWGTLGLVALVVLVLKRVRWAWGIVGDAVALETTRYPEPLVRALRRMAGYNGDQVPVPGSWGGTDAYWVLPVRRKVEVATFVVNNRAAKRSSTEQVSDAALLLRAGIVERVCLGGDPATLASWEAAAATFERLGRAAGWRGGDGTIDGVEVTAKGVGAGALPPVGGSWSAH